MTDSIIDKALERGGWIVGGMTASLGVLLAYVVLNQNQRLEFLIGLYIAGTLLAAATATTFNLWLVYRTRLKISSAGANAGQTALDVKTAELTTATTEVDRLDIALKAANADLAKVIDERDLAQNLHVDLGGQYAKLEEASNSCLAVVSKTVSAEKLAFSVITARKHIHDLSSAEKLTRRECSSRSRLFFNFIVETLFFRLQEPVGLEYAGVWRAGTGRSASHIVDKASSDVDSVEQIRTTIAAYLRALPPGQDRAFIVHEQGIDSSSRGIATLCLHLQGKDRNMLVVVATQREDLYDYKLIFELIGSYAEDFLVALRENQSRQTDTTAADA